MHSRTEIFPEKTNTNHPTAVSGKSGQKAIVLQFMTIIASLTIIFIFYMAGEFLYAKIRESETFKIKRIIIEGNERLTDEKILEIASIGQKTCIFDVNPKKVESNLERNCWIIEAHVKTLLPDTIEIRVSERKVDATILINSKLYDIDTEGNIFRIHSMEEEIKGFLITGFTETMIVRNREMVTEEIRKILKLVKLYNKFGLDSFARVGEVHREEGGEITLYTLKEAKAIKLGKGKLKRKLLNLKKIMSYFSGRKILWRYILADSDVDPDKIVVGVNNHFF